MHGIKNGAVLYAKDYRKIADFYKNITELQESYRDTTYVALESDSFQLVVLQIPKQLSLSIEITEPPVKRENNPIKLMFYVKELNKIRQKIIQLGGILNGSDKEWEFDGDRVCDGHDPEGNIFQLRVNR